MGMSLIILSTVACPSLPYYSTWSHKRYDFGKNTTIATATTTTTTTTATTTTTTIATTTTTTAAAAATTTTTTTTNNNNNNNNNNTATTSSSSSVVATARCGLWPVEKYLSIFPYLSPTLSIFSLPAFEDLFLLLLSILSWVFLYVSSLPVLDRRFFWASYPPPFSSGGPANLYFAHISILLHLLLYSTLLVLDSSYYMASKT